MILTEERLCGICWSCKINVAVIWSILVEFSSTFYFPSIVLSINHRSVSYLPLSNGICTSCFKSKQKINQQKFKNDSNKLHIEWAISYVHLISIQSSSLVCQMLPFSGIVEVPLIHAKYWNCFPYDEQAYLLNLFFSNSGSFHPSIKEKSNTFKVVKHRKTQIALRTTLRKFY